MKQSLVTLDLEGVLVPEIWIALAEKTGIEDLRQTTRDIPDYDVLMKHRLSILQDHKLHFSEIEKVIGTLSPLKGAGDFLDELRSLTQVIILSDTFEEFAKPLMKQLNCPTIFCHRLEIERDQILQYHLRQPDPKRSAVAAFQSLNYKVIAAGDAFNDTAMLSQADVGYLFCSPENVRSQFPEFISLEHYSDLLKMIKADLK